jgi:hypothetical protein
VPATLATTDASPHLLAMLGILFHRKLIALGLLKPWPRRETAEPAQDDFVARHGLSYGESPDLLSDEARFEAERQKNFRRPPRH